MNICVPISQARKDNIQSKVSHLKILKYQPRQLVVGWDGFPRQKLHNIPRLRIKFIQVDTPTRRLYGGKFPGTNAKLAMHELLKILLCLPQLTLYRLLERERRGFDSQWGLEQAINSLRESRDTLKREHIVVHLRLVQLVVSMQIKSPKSLPLHPRGFYFYAPPIYETVKGGMCGH